MNDNLRLVIYDRRFAVSDVDESFVNRQSQTRKGRLLVGNRKSRVLSTEEELMKTGALVQFCRALPRATEDIKWGKDLVFSIGGKMFACFDTENNKQVSFKASPAMFSLLAAKKGIVPAPYLARHEWVLVEDTKVLPPTMLKELLRESYQLVAAKLPAKLRKELGIISV